MGRNGVLCNKRCCTYRKGHGKFVVALMIDIERGKVRHGGN
jgi:hypothetical protein